MGAALVVGGRVIAEVAATAAGAWALHALAHQAILRALRAPRTAHPEPSAQAAAAGLTAVRLCGPQGRSLFGWWLPPPAAPSPALVVMHGWGANATLMLPLALALRAQGWAVLVPDARCHGRSDDEAYTSLPRFAEDIDAALDWLHAQPGIDTSRLALAGHSVGAGAALLCATRRDDLAAVLSLSAFAHPREVMRRWLAEHRLPYPLLGWYVLHHVQRVIGARFDDIAPLASIARVRCPVLLVHGCDDRTVPFADAERLQAAGAGRAVLLPVQAGHDIGDALAAHTDEVTGFLHRAFDGGRPRAWETR